MPTPRYLLPLTLWAIVVTCAFTLFPQENPQIAMILLLLGVGGSGVLIWRLRE
jgi:hypothetical protein